MATEDRKTWWRWGAMRGVLRVAAVVMVMGVMLMVGVRQGREKIAKIRDNPYIGHSDEASYALQGKSLLQGRGTRVDYVSEFTIVYPREIVHREDHWPPFLPGLIAPCYWKWGVAAWVARLPGIWIASLGLPLVTVMLTWGVSRRGYAALAAGLIMMMAPQVYGQSMRVLSDGATAMMVAGFCGSVVWAGRRKCGWMYVAAGVFLAGAYFAKASELMLLGIFPVLAVMTSWRGWRVMGSKLFWFGVLTAVVLMGPSWWANWRDYGNPVHTTQNFVAGYFGIEPTEYWERGMYYPYWGQDLPKISDRWTKHPDYRQRSREQMVVELQYVLAGGSGTGDITSDFGVWGVKVRDYLMDKPGPTTAEAQAAERAAARAKRAGKVVAPATMKAVEEWHSPVWTVVGAGAMVAVILAGVVLVGIGLVRAGMWVWAKTRNTNHETQKATDDRLKAELQTGDGSLKAVLRTVLGVAMVAGVHGVFLAYFWRVDGRFCFPMLPLVLALGCAMGVWLVEGPFVVVWEFLRAGLRWVVRWKRGVEWMEWFTRGVRYEGLVLTILAAGVVMLSQERVAGIERKMMDREGAMPPRSNGERVIKTGKWISSEVPNGVVMCRNPWELLYYMGAENKGVGLPNPCVRDEKGRLSKEDSSEEGAEKIFAIARYYHVTHMVRDAERACLRPYFSGEKAGLKRVGDVGREMYPVYELDWSVLPGKTVEEVFGK